MWLIHEIARALQMSIAMLWDVFWPLALGFLLSATVQTVVPRRSIERPLGDDSLKSTLIATALGAISSSCSYAAVSVARTLFQKGATLTNSIIFEFASTNLVFELGLAMFVLLGWQFVAAEFAGGLIMIALFGIIMHFSLTKQLKASARAQAAKGLTGKMEGHGNMDMSVSEGTFFRRLFSGKALTAISHYFFMDVASLWTDLLAGFLIAGALAAWVPDSFWKLLFLTDHREIAFFWGPLIGPIISMLSFVCSVGNVPLAAVLWRGGISFGGVISFIFADLLIPPILNIYRKYYGGKVAVYLAVVSYVSMAGAGMIVEALFSLIHLAPKHLSGAVATVHAHPETTVLNTLCLLLIAFLSVRFFQTGGPEMLTMMSKAPARTGEPVESCEHCQTVHKPAA